MTRITIPRETPYVVRLLNCQILSNPKPVFEFRHPKKNLNESNERYISLTFECGQDCTVHGFAGFFESVLYDDITMSIHPEHHSPDLISWFPLVFPLDKPIQVSGSERITVHLWRCTASREVWYEWAVTQPSCSKLHNAAGRAYKIGL
ncbi:hypothetical protein Ciccas_006262 [Cichlidogyrus casuarinus]|uniref:PRMT5 oligomerisation domain-containing protein n=1 Tax=Cichlidogyrus casuarinus TaxID=1844966 RepID=A0ABD2Q6A0_9PLAT